MPGSTTARLRILPAPADRRDTEPSLGEPAAWCSDEEVDPKTSRLSELRHRVFRLRAWTEEAIVKTEALGERLPESVATLRLTAEQALALVESATEGRELGRPLVELLAREATVAALYEQMRRCAHDLRQVGGRARAAAQGALTVAMQAPHVAAAVRAELGRMPPSLERDVAVVESMQAPIELKRLADVIRADLVAMPARAAAVRESLRERVRALPIALREQAVTRKLRRFAGRVA